MTTPGGLDLAALRPSRKREDRPTILFSGALTEPRKGLRTILRALPLIAASEPEVQLWHSGPGDPTQLLSAVPADVPARVAALDVGDPQEQGERYGRAWITALPSVDNSFRMGLVESKPAERPSS